MRKINISLLAFLFIIVAQAQKTSFESSEGFSKGQIDGQNGWAASDPQSASLFKISDAKHTDGSWSLELGQDTNGVIPSGNIARADWDVSSIVGAPNFFKISADVYVGSNATGEFDFMILDPQSSGITFRIAIFNGNAAIIEVDQNGDLVAVNQEPINTNSFNTLTVEFDFINDHIIYYVNGVSVYTGGFFSGQSIGSISFATSGEEDYYVDNLTFCDPPENIGVSNIDKTTADVSWSAGGNESEWKIIYGKKGFDPFSSGKDTTVTGSSNVTLQNLIPNKKYDVFIKGYCSPSKTSTFNGPEGFTTDSEPCDDPSNIVINNIGSKSADVAWTPGGNETEWYLSFGDPGFDPDSQGYEVHVDNGGTPATTLHGLQPNTQYDLYVRAACTQYSNSDRVGPESFTTKEACADPSAVQISNITYNSADVTWTPGDDETEWHVIYDESSFDINVDGDTINVTGNPQTAITGLDDDTEYDVYVVAICGANVLSEAIGPKTFKTDKNLSVNSEVFRKFTYYPNPVKEKLNLKAGKKIESVQIYNLLGQEIFTISPNRLNTQLNTANLESGIYLMNVEIGGGKKSYQLIKK